MTFPRQLKLVRVGNDMRVASKLASEITFVRSSAVTGNNISLSNPYMLPANTAGIHFPFLLNLSTDDARDFSIQLSNEKGEALLIGYHKTNNQYFIDRSIAGQSAFHKDFAARHMAPRFVTSAHLNLTLLVDVTSAELFADDGLTVMTEIFFPSKPYNKITLTSGDKAVIKQLEYYPLKP